MAKDKVSENGVVSADEAAAVVTITREEYEALLAARDNPDFGANPAPAIEEGPHLQDPDIRAAKIEQVSEHGDRISGLDMPDDMRDIVNEAEV